MIQDLSILYDCQDLSFDLCRPHYSWTFIHIWLMYQYRIRAREPNFESLRPNILFSFYFIFGPRDLVPEMEPQRLHRFFSSFSFFLIRFSWDQEVVGSISLRRIYLIFFCSWLFWVDREGVGSNLHNLNLIFSFKFPFYAQRSWVQCPHASTFLLVSFLSLTERW